MVNEEPARPTAPAIANNRLVAISYTFRSDPSEALRARSPKTGDRIQELGGGRNARSLLVRHTADRSPTRRQRGTFSLVRTLTPALDNKINVIAVAHAEARGNVEETPIRTRKPAAPPRPT